MFTILYILNDLVINQFGGKYFIRYYHGNLEELRFSPMGIDPMCDFIIKFDRGNYSYIKSRSYPEFLHSEKDLMIMMLKAKTYGSIKTN